MSDQDAITRLNAALEGRYRIERQLGEGGMATVYLARDLKHNRNVALKVLKPELAAVVGAERFLAEIETTANLQHPHILPLFDSGEADTFLFYVMPYVEGETLKERIDRDKQLPVEEAVRITTAVAQALQHAHDRGVIHRDIKPANILLQDGQPLVSDFGIALAVGVAGGGRLTETGLSLGTPHYMSPEQATGDQSIGTATDLYALGCVLYEMLVGEPPFTGSTAQAILGKIIGGELPSATKQRASVPPNVDHALRKSLEKLSADRFPTASSFAAALTDPNYRYGIATSTISKGHPWKRIAMLNGTFAIAAAVVAVWALGRLGSDVEVPVVRFTAAIPGGSRMVLGQFPNLALSPDGRTIVFGAEGRLFKRTLDSFESEPIEGTEGARYPFFSPEGRWIAFSRDGRFQRIPAAGGPATDIAEGAIPSALGATWGEDDAILYASSDIGGPIRRVPVLGGGGPEPVSVVDSTTETTHAWPQSLDGGRLLLFTAVGPGGLWDDAKIVLQEVDTGRRVTVAEGVTFGRYVGGHLLYVQRDGTVLATPFDLRSRSPTGEPFAVQSNVRVGYWAGGASLAVSRGGTMAFVQGSNWEYYELWWVDRDGTRLSRLGPPITTEEFDLSHDDRRVLVGRFQASSHDLFSLDAVTGDPTRLTFDGGHWSGIWSPNGTRMAYNATGAAEATVLVRDVDSASEPTALYSSRHLDYVESWSPDGRWLLVHETSPETSGDLLVVGVDTAEVVIRVAVTTEREGQGHFAPDGRSIAYESDGEIVVVSFPDLTRKAQVSTNGGRRPQWSPAGDELFFWSDSTLMVASVPAGGAFGWEAPRPLFELPDLGRAYDVSSDATRFLVQLESPSAVSSEIYVVQNFLEELNRLAPTN